MRQCFNKKAVYYEELIHAYCVCLLLSSIRANKFTYKLIFCLHYKTITYKLIGWRSELNEQILDSQKFSGCDKN